MAVLKLLEAVAQMLGNDGRFASRDKALDNWPSFGTARSRALAHTEVAARTVRSDATRPKREGARHCFKGGAGSEGASSGTHRSLGKRDYPCLSDLSSGESAAFLPAGSQAAGTISVLLAVRPLKQDIKQEVTPKNAKRQKHGR
jgi:hypothetical protein